MKLNQFSIFHPVRGSVGKVDSSFPHHFFAPFFVEYALADKYCVIRSDIDETTTRFYAVLPVLHVDLALRIYTNAPAIWLARYFRPFAKILGAFFPSVFLRFIRIFYDSTAEPWKRCSPVYPIFGKEFRLNNRLF